MQKTENEIWVKAILPSCGWTTLNPGDPYETENSLNVTENVLENELLRLEFNELGELISIYDKEAGRELAAAPCSSLRMYKDVPSAWDIDSMYALTPVELNDPAGVEIVANGPLFARAPACC